eukprot:SAG11_NODE_32581_length_282_cov_1.120219_1_plen_94_part_11
MVVHFLQRCEPPILGPLHLLLATSPSDDSIWPTLRNCARRNKQSVTQLFRGFVGYYSAYDYATRPLCTLALDEAADQGRRRGEEGESAQKQKRQ